MRTRRRPEGADARWFDRSWSKAPDGDLGSSQFERVIEALGHRDDARSSPKVIRAAGVKIEKMPAEQLRAVAGHTQPWQKQAWGYRDAIGELRFVLQYRARAIARTRLLIAQVIDDDDEPIPVSLRNEVDDDGQPTEKAKLVTAAADLCEAAEVELARLPLDAGYSFLGIWSENFDVAGECYLHGRQLPDSDQEEWTIRSILDVDTQGSEITIRDELGQPRRLDLSDPKRDYIGTEELFRLWVPHPARPHLADSALHSLADVLEDILLAGREVRSASRSRSANNGIWFIPIGMTQMRDTKPNSDKAEDQSTRFMSDTQAALLAPISNEGDPGSVAPIMITGTREDIEVASKSFLRFDRETKPETLDRLDRSIRRMATGLDCPPELLTGMADVNHWTAWLIDASTFRHYLEPSLRLMVDSLTVAYLRRALIAQGFTADEVRQLRIWYDAGQITENPNRRQDALDAREHGAIGDDSFRQALGFNEGDAPTPEERLLMIALKSGMDQATVAAILALWAQREGEPELLPQPPPAQAIGPGRTTPSPSETPGGTPPDPAGVGGTGTPETAPNGVAASGQRGISVRAGESPLIVHQHDERYWADVHHVSYTHGLGWIPADGVDKLEYQGKTLIDVTGLLANPGLEGSLRMDGVTVAHLPPRIGGSFTALPQKLPARPSDYAGAPEILDWLESVSPSRLDGEREAYSDMIERERLLQPPRRDWAHSTTQEVLGDFKHFIDFYAGKTQSTSDSEKPGSGKTTKDSPASPYRLDTATPTKLMEAERALRIQLLTDTDHAIHRALQRAGNRLRSKLTAHQELHNQLTNRTTNTAEWAAIIGREATLAAGANLTYLLNQAWDELRDTFTSRVTGTIAAIIGRLNKRLGQDGATAHRTAQRINNELTGRIGAAWNNYRAKLDQLAEQLMFGEAPEEAGDGELSGFDTPPAYVRAALAEIGGLPETSGGLHRDRPVTGEPLGGLANGATITRELEAAGIETVGYLWVYGVTPQARRFDPHWELEGERFLGWGDLKLQPEPKYQWIGPFYRPGDHAGCMCDYVPGYAIPDYAGQVNERLSSPSAVTQDVLDLAALDDREGRTGTDAQAKRDRHAAIQQLQRRFMEGS